MSKKKINKNQLTHWIGKLGYEIIDEIISPMCEISDVVADLYLADVITYAVDDKLADKIIKKIKERYKIDYYIMPDTPIALIVLVILEDGVYA